MAVAGWLSAVLLHFHENLGTAFSKIGPPEARNTAMTVHKMAIDKSDPPSMPTQLPMLKSGQYLVRWSTMTRDGHKAKGEYRFKVK